MYNNILKVVVAISAIASSVVCFSHPSRANYSSVASQERMITNEAEYAESVKHSESKQEERIHKLKSASKASVPVSSSASSSYSKSH